MTVDLTTSGQPCRVYRGGRVWIVGAVPVRWFERTRWWHDELRMSKGSRIGIDVEVWMVQVRLGRGRGSELVTWELVHHASTGRWKLRENRLNAMPA